MPTADLVDIASRRTIRDPTREEMNAEFMRVCSRMNHDQLMLIEMVARALWPKALGVAPDCLPMEISDGPDAELIRLCGDLSAVERALKTAYDVMPQDEKRRAVVIDPLNSRWLEITALILKLGRPTTPEGAKAAALALLDQYPDGRDEAIQVCNLAAWAGGNRHPRPIVTAT